VGRSVRALAQLKMLTSMKCQVLSPRAGQHIYIDVPLRIKPLSKNVGSIDASATTQQTRHPASDAHEAATCPTQSNFQRSFLRQQTRPSLDRRGPVRSEPSSTHQTRPSVVHQTHLAFVVTEVAELLTQLATDADARRLTPFHRRV
jgi:hypothetical protein